MSSQIRSPPQRAEFAIDVLIIGGGIAGLACGIALGRVGHRVTILEKTDGSSKVQTSGGCRIPPNMSKVLFHWGLEEELRKISLTSMATQIALFESGDVLGRHLWEEEVLKETGGEFIFMHHGVLVRLLQDTAKKHGVRIRYHAEVASIEGGGCAVRLTTGEVVQAHMVVGADGPTGLARQRILEDNDDGAGADSVASPIGMTMYNTVIPGKVMMSDPILKSFVVEEHTKDQFVWFGHGCCVIAFSIGARQDFNMQIVVPRNATDGDWEEFRAREEILSAVGATPCEPRLKRLVENASSPIQLPVKNFEELEDWVHEDGRLVVIGEAAHPLPPGSIQACAMALEDGAVLGKLFSHLLREDQIPSFLYAFQELRQKRCRDVLQGEMGNLHFMCMPSGEQQEARDNEMRRRGREGTDLFGASGEGGGEEWESIKTLFAYEVEDEADNWWVEWGILREHANRVAAAA